MSKEVMIGMLKVANTGNDLLQILDALTDTTVSYTHLTLPTILRV